MGAEINLRSPDPNRAVATLVTQPGGEWVAAAVAVRGAPMRTEMLRLGEAEGAGGFVVAEGHVSSLPLSWSPDGRWLLLSMEPGASREDALGPWYQLVILNILYPVSQHQPDAFAHLWVYDTVTGKLGLLPRSGGHGHALWARDGTLYYVTAEGRVVGVRVGGVMSYVLVSCEAHLWPGPPNAAPERRCPRISGKRLTAP